MGAEALQEVDDILLKDTLNIISDREPAFYSRLFLMEKACSGWKPIINLPALSTEHLCGSDEVQDGNCDLGSVLHLEKKCHVLKSEKFSQISMHFALSSILIEWNSLPVQISIRPMIKPGSGSLSFCCLLISTPWGGGLRRHTGLPALEPLPYPSRSYVDIEGDEGQSYQYPTSIGFLVPCPDIH